jgi:hypothetical protein
MTALAASTHVALLAPVPASYLEQGEGVIAAQGRVAFGSRAWETFRELDHHRMGHPVRVYFYASHEGWGSLPTVTWRGRYVRHVDATPLGGHPAGLNYRPPAAAACGEDGHGHWAVFYELDQLERLAVAEQMETHEFRGFERRRPFARGFIPQGPLVIRCP